MKRAFIVLLALAIIGCTKTTTVNRQEIQTEEAAEIVTIEPASTSKNSTHTETTGPISIPEETTKASTTEVVTYAFSLDQVSPYVQSTTQTAFDATLCEHVKTNDGWEYRFHNETVEYRDLKISVTAFDPSSETEALKLSITVPANWNDSFEKEMIEKRLHFVFEIDGRQVDAFRDRIITRVSSHEYELVYKTCLLRPLYGKALSIRPFVTCLQNMFIWDSEEKTIDLTKTKELCVAPENLNSMSSTRHYLDHCAVTIHTDLPEREKVPILYPITVEEVDWEASYQKGCYGDGNVPSETANIFLKKKDFSDIVFALESLQIKDDIALLTFTWRFPDSFSDAECQSMVRSHLKFYAYFDDDMLISQKDTRSRAGAPFGRTRTLSAIMDVMYMPSYENYRTNNYRELHYTVIGSPESVSEWKTHRSLTVVPYYWYYTAVDYENGIGGAKKTCELSESGIHLENQYSVRSDTFDCKAIDELAMRIELTPELFEEGF